jgi:hypothetical protein
MVKYIIQDDMVLVIDDSFLDSNGLPIITSMTLEEYEKIKGNL